jgi:hypothetical protein
MRNLPTNKQDRVIEALCDGIRIGDTFGLVNAIREITKGGRVAQQAPASD